MTSTRYSTFKCIEVRTAQLEDIDLDGVLWSDRTRWPSAVNIEDLKARPQETPEGSGIYTIQPGTTKTRGLAGPTQ